MSAFNTTNTAATTSHEETAATSILSSRSTDYESSVPFLPFSTVPGSASVEDYRYAASVVQGNTFTVDLRYDFHDSKILGRSASGVVCSVFDKVEQKPVALRRYRPYADDDWDARVLLRELRILKLFNHHPHVSLFPISLHSWLFVSDKMLFCRSKHFTI